MDLSMALASVDTGEDSFEGEELLNVIYSEGVTELPNCKELFIPDDGYTFFDVDYSGADAMVVGWDSECEWLMDFFTNQDEKLYIFLGQQYLQRPMTTSDPLYKKFKAFCHGSNYGMGVDKAARTAGMSLLEAKKLQKFYFDLCPEIPKWHKRIKDEVYKRGYVENIFGARGYFLNRNDHTLLNKAYAYIPQSTIGIMVNKGLVSIEKEAAMLTETRRMLNKGGLDMQKHTNLSLVTDDTVAPIEVLMQVHDSLAGQIKTTDVTAPERIIKHMSIELPYKTPLVIPVDIATSVRSYGDC